jgi:hypothetical protein
LAILFIAFLMINFGGKDDITKIIGGGVKILKIFA